MNPGKTLLLNSKSDLFYAEYPQQNELTEGEYLSQRENIQKNLSGIILNQQNNKRVLWYGFEFNQMIGNERDQFLFNSLNWLSGNVSAFINAYPNDYSSCSIIYKIVQNKNQISEYFSDNKNQINLFIPPQLFEESEIR